MGPSNGQPQDPGIVRSGRDVAGGDTVGSGGCEEKGDDEDGMPGVILMDLIIVVVVLKFDWLMDC